ncbi:MAG: biopolymer transporter ExbD [Chitinophagaceae bacterium]|jgi:biopolymer transport protein ExbD|nr:biopolymer transporter ExbD [Chitinophagaceae bacterium]
MTAFCDVAFLLLAFFILTTKFKPPEAISVTTPNSVSSKAAEDKNQVLFTISPEGKVFLSLSEEDKRMDVVDDLNKRLNLQLTDADIKRAAKAEFFASPLSTLKSYLSLEPDQRKGDALPGIPCVDSTNNEVNEWLASAVNVFFGAKMNLMVKGDQDVPYPTFKLVIDAFKKNDQMKFQVVTNQEAVPEGSPLSKKQREGAASSSAEQ